MGRELAALQLGYLRGPPSHLMTITAAATSLQLHPLNTQAGVTAALILCPEERGGTQSCLL